MISYHNILSIQRTTIVNRMQILHLLISNITSYLQILQKQEACFCFFFSGTLHKFFRLLFSRRFNFHV